MRGEAIRFFEKRSKDPCRYGLYDTVAETPEDGIGQNFQSAACCPDFPLPDSSRPFRDPLLSLLASFDQNKAIALLETIRKRAEDNTNIAAVIRYADLLTERDEAGAETDSSGLYHNIAGEFNIPLGTAKSRIFHGRKHLQGLRERAFL